MLNRADSGIWCFGAFRIAVALRLVEVNSLGLFPALRWSLG